MDASTSTTATCDDYRRQARRLRAIHAGNPAKLYRSLKFLAAEQARQLAGKPTSAAQELADLVRNSMDGPILRYSVRQRLIRHAAARGIARFQANLIIAAVQHEMDRVRFGRCL